MNAITPAAVEAIAPAKSGEMLIPTTAPRSVSPRYVDGSFSLANSVFIDF